MKKIILLFLFATLSTTVVNANSKQGHFKWRNDDGTAAAATAIEAEDTDASFVQNVNIRLRVEVYNNNPGSGDFITLGLFYSADGTTWTRMTSSSTEFQLSSTAFYTEADATTNVLTITSGSHVDGFLIESTDTWPFSFASGNSYEFEYSFKATPAVALGTSYLFEIRDGQDLPISSYDRIPALTIFAETVWTGANSTDYNDILNWSNGVPTAGHNVTIPVVATVYPTVIASTTGYCNDLEIAAGASLEVSGGVLVGTGEIIVQSDASSSGSLIGSIYDGSSGQTEVIYNRYVTGGQWHLMGAPFESQDIGDLIDDASSDISVMKDYNVTTDAWNTDFTNVTAGTMTSGEGYAIKRSTDGVISISGTVPSNPNVTLDKTGNGWNLLGNPYASAVYATDPGVGTSFLLNTSNVGSMASGYEALYVWEENISQPSSTNNYKTVNNALTGNLNKTGSQKTHLQAGQGFFVKASATATTFDFSTSMQDHQSTLSLYKEEAAQWPTVTINAEISNAKASTTITYNSMMTKGLDKTYDAGLLNSYPEFALYSRLVEDYEGIDFMLQALPEDYDNLIIPIGLDAKAGEIVTFSAKTLNIPEGYVVIIEDRAMNTFTNLSDGGESAVQLTNDSDGTGRFFVRTSIESTLGLGDLDTEKAFQVFTRVQDRQLVIRGEFTVNTVARIYSITGKKIAIVNLEQSTENYVQFNEESGVYIVQISNDHGTYTQKFSWVK